MAVSRAWPILVLVLAPGCRQIFGLDDGTLARPDGGGGYGIDGPECFGTGLVTICPDMVSPTTVTLHDTPIDTGTCITANSDACVIAGQDIHVIGNVRVTGARPLVLVARGAIVIEAGATLDASSSLAAGPGAGADTHCGPAIVDSDDSGGAGGSFGGQGGNGGAGATGGLGGISAPPVADKPAELEGGCSGENGSTLDGAMVGLGGFGGGAVYAIANHVIEIDGRIDASGSGGSGGSPPSAGGGGGGAGGMLGLDAPAIVVSATGVVMANGGGGGEGAGTGSIGISGAQPTSPASPAPGGGDSNPNAGDGGDGGFEGRVDGQAGIVGTSTAGGGGGGGGVGFVLIYGVLTKLGTGLAAAELTHENVAITGA